MTNEDQATTLVGHTVLWIGNECQNWTPGQFAAAAQFARSVGVDTICPKRADGSIKWYGTPEQLQAERAAVLAEGCGFIPMLYSYGPRFGTQQIHDECAALAEMMSANGGSVCCDMESEWNGAVAMAALFAALMRPVPGMLFVTTWADPALQDWSGVAEALASAVNVWIPQRYTDWLAAQPLPAQETTVHPGLDLTQEFGTNHPAQLAQGYESVWLWEYDTATANPPLVRQITSRHNAPITSPAPVSPANPMPTPLLEPVPAAPQPDALYRVISGDSLWSIAAHFYGNGDLWPRIWEANRATIINPNQIQVNAIIHVPRG